MIIIPNWLINVLLLATAWLSGYQLVQLRLKNPIPSLQFAMVLFCLLMVLVVAVKNRHNPNPWLSLAFFLIAVVNLTVMVRQHRFLPHRKPLE